MTSRLCFIVSKLEGHSPVSLSNRSTQPSTCKEYYIIITSIIIITFPIISSYRFVDDKNVYTRHLSTTGMNNTPVQFSCSIFKFIATMCRLFGFRSRSNRGLFFISNFRVYRSCVYTCVLFADNTIGLTNPFFITARKLY